MQITSKQLKQIIKEELEAVLNEGSLTYVKQQLGTAGRHNPWLKSFGSLQYLSGPENSLVNWVSQAENSNDPQAKEALNKVRQLMRQHKESEMTEAPMTEQSVTGLPIEKDVLEIFRDGIDPQAAAEKLAIHYSYTDFEKFKEAFEFGDWSGPAMNALNNFNYEVLPIMMRIA